MNGYSLIIISQIVLGSVAVFARWSGLPAEWVTLFRCVFGAASLAAVVLLSRRIEVATLRRAALPLVLTGICMGLNWMFFFEAVLTTEISKAILLYNTAPFFVVVSSTLFLKEPPTVRQVLCLLVALVGVGVITGSTVGNLRMEAGDAFAILAALLYAQVTVLGRHLKQVPAPVLTLAQTAVGALAVLPLALAHDGDPVRFVPTTWMILITMGVFHTAVPYLMYFQGLKTVKASAAGILQYIYTLSTIVFAIAVFNEPLTPQLMLGGVVILVASFVALRHPGNMPITRLLRPAVGAIRKAQ